MKLRVRDVDLRIDRCRARQPFRFGSSTLTSAPMLLARARIEAEGGIEGAGFAADLLVPKWFDKDPTLSAKDDAAALVSSARAAAAAFRAGGTWPSTPFELWLQAFRDCVLAGKGAPGELVRGFGVALIERAVLDAVCRAAGRSFFHALKEDLFGFRPELVHSELAGWDLAASLPEQPLRSIRVRHTIGLADPLTAADAFATPLPDDGLPRTLEEHVQRHGLDAFKIKLGGQPADDVERVRAIASVIEKLGVARPLFTLDANEQYADPSALLAVLRTLAGTPEGELVVESLAYIEQPLPRARAFHPSVESGLAALTEYAPVIVDESDSGLCAFERAIASGYRGISVKNCKGVFRALLHRGLCERTGRGHFLAAEDLTTLPVVTLHEDLATIAALGLEHSERNGHHYFARLEHLPKEEAAAALVAHPDVYQDLGGGPELRIQRGRIEIGSLQCIGFGYSAPVQFDARAPLEEWSFD